jgi:hypothetical protein
MLKVFLFISFYTNFLFADCTLSDGSVILEGAQNKQSLLAPGKSLESHKVQDQDSSSVLLKSILPSNPDISYHHAAISYSADKRQNVTQSGDTRFMRAGTNNRDTFVERGRVCQTIDSLKKAGGACPKENSELENQTLGDPEVQSRIYKGLGKYFDLANSVKSSNMEQDRLESEVDSAIDLIQEKIKNKSCGNQNIPGREGLKDLIPSLNINSLGCLSREEFNSQINFQNATLFNESFSHLSNPSAVRIFSQMQNSGLIVVSNPNPSLILKLEEKMNNDPVFLQEFDKYLNNSESEPSNDLSVKLAHKLNDVFHEIYPQSKLSKCKIKPGEKYHPFTGVLRFGPPSQSEIPDSPHLISMGKTFLNAARIEKKGCQSDFMRTTKFQEEIKDLLKTRNSQNSSCPISNGNVIADAILPLIELDKDLDKSKIKEILSNPFTKGAKQLTSYLMPGCDNNKNLLPLDNIECFEHGLCHFSNVNTKFQGPQGGCLQFNQAKKIFAKKAVDTIKNGVAFNVHICLDFLQGNPNIKTNFCKTSKKGFHEMAVTGFRCLNGKMEYEVLNSWGSQYCPIGRDPANNKSESFECELNSEGKFTGKFWVKEDVLVENTQTFSVINKKVTP